MIVFIHGGIPGVTPYASGPHVWGPVLQRFSNGMALEVSDTLGSMEYVHQVSEIKGLKAAVTKLSAQGNPAVIASAVEFILEGLHLNKKLNKDRLAGKATYRG